MDARTTDLIADLHVRHDAWRRQGEDLARLHADAHAAAGREATAILASARDDISQVLVDARRALLVLTAQLHAIPESAHVRADPGSDGAVSESVLQARRDLQRLLADIRPELDEVAAQVGQCASPVVPVETAVALAANREPTVGHRAASEDVQAAAIAEADHTPAPKRAWRFLIALLLVAAASRVTPSWMNEPIPTVTASLVAMPPAPAMPQQPAEAQPPSPRRP